MTIYKTSEVASIIGVHPNTVRLYEEWGLISKPERLENGYRIFTDLHIRQMQLARIAFQIELLQNGLRKKIYFSSSKLFLPYMIRFMALILFTLPSAKPLL